MTEKRLWRLVAGRKMGPYDPAKLRPLVKDGRIGPLDRFSYDGASWRPAGDFPELLRPPPAPAELEDDVSRPLAPPPDLPSESDDLLGPPSLSAGREAPGDDTAILKAVYWLVGLGAAFVLLLVGMIMFRSFRKPPPPAPPTTAVAATATQAPPPTTAQHTPPEMGVDGGQPPREDGESSDQPPTPQAEPGSKEEKEIYEALDKVVDDRWEFNETPLRDVQRAIADQFGIPVAFDIQALEDAGLDLDIPVSQKISGVKLGTALHRLLGEIGLAYIVENDALLITIKEKSEGPPGVASPPADQGKDIGN